MPLQNQQFLYFKESMEAEGHTPIYKMHKYFARRPQNIFYRLLETYSKEGDVVLDPFCGGGVTLIEGTSLKRKVIACDINPLATFISRAEIELVPMEDYLREIKSIRDNVFKFSSPLFSTRDRDTDRILPVRWYEHAYTVKCPKCGKETSLTNENRFQENDKIKNGVYVCENCHHSFAGVSCAHVGSSFLSVTYKVTTRATQKTVCPNEFDFEKITQAEQLYEKFIQSGEWFVPSLKIPLNWDRQQEDCLIRKGFLSFADFFTHRSLVVMAYFLNQVKQRKKYVSPELYRLLLLTFSATLRYTNNMTISTDAWQDGRPVAWAKHAYWLSYQFVEVNPIEYIDKRITAIKAALICQHEKNKGIHAVEDYNSFKKQSSSFLVLNQDSSSLPVDDESVDLVLTDPPYGGNVQYGELSAFWLSWLCSELAISEKQILELTGEILIHRKNKVNPKTYQSYYEGLRRVFSESYRVLKQNRPLVFTFNSKDVKVWIAVIKAAIDAGFVLEPDGVHYQSPIENYKNTAHTMFAGSVLGDFIYTFLKRPGTIDNNKNSSVNELQIQILDTIKNTIITELKNKKDAVSTSELYISIYKQIIPLFAQMVLNDSTYDFTDKIIGGKVIENSIRSLCKWDKEQAGWLLSKETL